MKTYSIPMALADYIPNILFLLSALNIIKFLRRKKKTFPTIFFGLGAMMIFSASMIKATYKLIASVGIGEIAWMTKQFFPNQAFGFLIIGLAMILALFDSKKLYSFNTMALVGIMVLGVVATNISLAIFAIKEKKKGLPILFILSMFLSLCMGYLSTKDFTQIYMNWLAEIVNICSMILLYLGTRKLNK